MTPSEVPEAAAWLVAARQEGRAATDCPWAAQLAEEDAGYRVQWAGYDRLQAAGCGLRAGYKIGCTNKAVQDLLAVPGPAYGGVMAANLHRDAATLDRTALQAPGIECEIAFRMADRPDPADAPFDRDSIAAYVADAAVAMEVVDNRYRDFRQAPFGLMIADDFFQVACITGPPRADWRSLDLAALAGSTALDGQVMAEGDGRNVMGHPLEPLAWLANRLAAQGRSLAAGEVVLTGTMVTPIWLEGGPCTATVAVEGLGEVSVRFR